LSDNLVLPSTKHGGLGVTEHILEKYVALDDSLKQAASQDDENLMQQLGIGINRSSTGTAAYRHRVHRCTSHPHRWLQHPSCSPWLCCPATS